jgi:hypothetical protein
MIPHMTMALAANPLALLLQAPESGQLSPDQQFQIAREVLQHTRGLPGALAVLVPILVPIGFFAMVVLLVWLGVRRRQAQFLAQSELRRQLLDKFGSAQELTAFIESKGGQQFLGDLQSRTVSQVPFLFRGVITTMLGIAFLLLTLLRHNFIFPAVIVSAAGIGLLISAGIAHKLASKRAGATSNPASGSEPFPQV